MALALRCLQKPLCAAGPADSATRAQLCRAPGLGSVSALVMAGLVLARREEGLQLLLLFAFFQWSPVNDLNVSRSRVILLILVAETCVE